MLDVHIKAFSLIAMWTLDVVKNSAWFVMDGCVWCFQLFYFNRMCSYGILTWYWYPRLGHTPFLFAFHRSLMFAYHPVGAYPFFHVDLGVWFLGYLSHLLAFLKCHIGAYPFFLWVAYSLSPLAALRHRVQIPYRSGGSQAWCLDPLSFYLFDGSPTSCSNPLSFR